MASDIPFYPPGSKSSSLPTNAHFTVKDPDDVDEYPSKRDSVHTMVLEAGTDVEKDHKPNFWQRAAYMWLWIFLLSIIRTFISNLATINARESGGLAGLQFPLMQGIAVFAIYFLSQHVITSLDPVLQIFELFMGHYKVSMKSKMERAILFAGCLIIAFGGAVVAAWATWAIQVDNTVTAAGGPLVSGNVWTAYGLEVFGSAIFAWFFFAGYFNPESWADARRTNVPVVLGVVTVATTWLAQPYSSGCFNFIRYIATSLVSGTWQTDGWVFAAGPVSGYLLISVVYYFVFRTTKQTGANTPAWKNV